MDVTNTSGPPNLTNELSEEEEDESMLKSSQQIHLYAYGVILPLLCVFGILGNIVNLITLNRPQLRAVSYLYLRCLAFTDIMCMLGILFFALKHLHLIPSSTMLAAWYGAHLELTLINIFINAEMLVVIGLSLERFLSVVHPIHFLYWNHRPKALMCVTLAYVTAVSCYAPMSLERQVIQLGVPDIYGIADNLQVISNPIFIAYKWAREVVLKIIPILLMAYLNLHTAIAIRRVQRRRASMVTKLRTKAQTRDDNRLMAFLCIKVALFFLCATPAAFNLIFIREQYLSDQGYQIFRATANILEVGKHGIIFYVLCACSSDYRQQFLLAFPLAHRLLCRNKTAAVVGRAEEALMDVTTTLSLLSTSKSHKSPVSTPESQKDVQL